MIPDFQPQSHLIANVTNAVQAQVTTTDVNGYTDGLVVRIFVPPVYGMSIPYVQTTIQIVDDTNFITDIDTSVLFPFVAPTFETLVTPAFTQAQVILISGTQDNIAPA